MRGIRRLAGLIAPIIGVLAASLAKAGDLPARQPDDPGRSASLLGSASLVDSNRIEVRGGYYATVLGAEQGSSAINAELIAPKLFSISWLPDFLVPRFHAGLTDSLSGKTSYGYVGALWRMNYTERIFTEFAFGG